MSRNAHAAATWNREDRDLLIELRTEMGSTRADIAAARLEIKEINTGITARLLNLESNAVSKVEIAEFDARLRTSETAITRINTWGSAAMITLGILEFALGLYVAAAF